MQRPNSIRNFFLRSIPYVVIFLLVTALFLTNYTRGTSLSGWDNLHPEFDCSINIRDRSLFSVWQEYQGLGVRAGNAHAADLLHQLGVCAASTVIPLPLIRYLYHFFALFVGGIGMYLCIKKLFLQKSSPVIQSIAALCGGLWYILNLGTMQYFSVPYEAFSHFFASFPWIILATLLYLNFPTKKHAWFVAGVMLLVTPSFYIPTLFVVQTGVLGIISLLHLGNKKTIRPLLFLWVSYGCINAFWLLPFVAFLFHGTAFVGQTMINRVFTEEAFLRNQQFGTIGDIALLKGFLFNTSDLVSATNTHDFVMRPWINFLQKPLPYCLHMSIFGLVITGIFASWKQKHPQKLLLTLLLAVGLFAFINDNPPTGGVFRFLQDHLPLFKQVFRFPFTKFLPIMTFSYATALSIALAVLFQKPILRTLAAGCIVAYLGIANIPAFQGNFLYKEMRVSIPNEYNEVFSYFNTQPNGIIATFPQATYWGWTTYDWGYRGSGFPWYGIKQPILDRNFDVWNTYNEKYYRAMTNALYASNDASALLAVCSTYDISYIWIDERVILPNNPDALYFEELKYRLATLPSVSLQFQNGKQSIYRINKQTNAFLNLQSQSPTRKPFTQASEVTTTINSDGSITLDTAIPKGFLTIPSRFTTNSTMLGIATRAPTSVTVTPELPLLFTDEQTIANATSASAIIPIPEKTNVLTINDTIITDDTVTPVPLLAVNTLKTYDLPSYLSDITQLLLTQPIKNCAASTHTASFFGITGQTLVGKASSPCVYAQISTLTRQMMQNTVNAVLQIQLSYKTTGPTPRVCLTKPGNTECLYRFQEASMHAVHTASNTTTYTLIPNTPIADLWMKIEFDAPETRQEKVTITAISLSVFASPTSVQNFSFKNEDPITVAVTQPTVLHATIPKTDQSLFTSVNQSKNEQSCYDLGTKNFKKTVLNDNGSYSRYEARKNSSICDWIALPDTTTQGFLISIQTRNISGRPIKTCLSLHPPNLCLYETILPVPKQNTWTTVNQLITPETTNGRWFLELDNYAVGNEIRVNDIGTINITPLPYTWLEQISIKPQQNTTPMITTTKISENHPNPSLYTTTIETGTHGILTLSQAYDSGWHAYTKKSRDIPQQVFEAFPVLFGNDLPDHMIVDNWKNGWTLPDDGSAQTVAIFFLPQLLEWLGFLLIPVPFLLIIKRNI